ncbi:MAG: hypothetical protein HUJ54_14885 [Erysipelotrichaceae bacterium]|nr:hypothetical protein [Erysipelotrichaceae bacterium]
MKSLLRRTAGYAMQPMDDPKSLQRLRKTIKTARELIRPGCIWEVFDLERSGQSFLLLGTPLALTGQLASEMLRDSEKCIVLGITLGPFFDQYLKRMKALDPDEAFLLDAAGTALIDVYLLDQEAVIKKQLPEWFFTDPFSCGYGDLPIELQPVIFSQLDLPGKLNLTLESAAMIRPKKSMTAFIGLSRNPQPHPLRRCTDCSMIKCTFKSENGSTCWENITL